MNDLYGLPEASDDWNEDGSSVPPFDLAGAGATLLMDDVDVSGSATAGFRDNGGVWVPLSLSNTAIDFINADTDGIVTLVFKMNVDGGKFYVLSKEADSTVESKAVTAGTNPFGTSENPNYGAYLSVTEVPEPASLAIFAGGALLMLRRRAIS